MAYPRNKIMYKMAQKLGHTWNENAEVYIFRMIMHLT